MADDAPDAGDVATKDLLLVAAMYRERYTAGISADFYSRLTEAEIQARARLSARLDRLTMREKARYEAGRRPTTQRHADLIAEIAALAAAYQALTAESLDRAGRELVPVELDFQSEMVERQGGSPATVTAAAVIAAAALRPTDGLLLGEGLKAIERNTGETATRSIRAGLSLGQNTGEIMEGLMGQHVPSGDGSALAKHRRGAEGLIRTQMNAQASEALSAVVADSKGYFGQLVTFDSRTSILCRSLSTLVQPWDAPDLKKAPHHFRCRTVTFWMPGPNDKPKGTRASKGAGGRTPINADIPLSTWMRRQGREFTADSIGTTRMKLFFDGGLKLEQFSDLGALRPLNLVELKARHADAFRRAEVF